jgi:hypothetical protein
MAEENPDPNKKQKPLTYAGKNLFEKLISVYKILNNNIKLNLNNLYSSNLLGTSIGFQVS